ncbi:MAG TPA: CHAT domain-containing protein, partial [candidate division Zixibacteria bacterium]|nr:CHAT domain-containing protein [candidate division Zixibacteria bacterium]
LSPHRRLILAECQTRPLSAAVWSERYKTAGVWSPVVDLNQNEERAKVEQSLVDLARRVSSYSHQITGIAGERGNLAPESRGSFGELQRQVQQKLASIEKYSIKNDESQDRIWRMFEAASMEQPLVQFHIGNNDILTFVHWQKETILRRFPDGRPKLAKLLRKWRFILEEELLQRHLGHKNSVDTENKLFDELGDWLWKPLEISDHHKRILVLPEGELANIPWQALRINGRPLAENHSFVMAPSLRHYIHAREISVNSSEIRVFVGESDDLPQISMELDKLSKLSNKHVSIMNPANRNDWSQNDSAELWHYSGHAFLRSDNPFYSYLTLADGPLFAADFRLKNSKVELVTLAACRSGEQVALSGEEATGLVRSLLEMGARNVIAGHWPVSDESTAMWMTEFYSGYFDNETLSDAAVRASFKVREKYPSAYHWAAFSVFGAGGRSNAYN